ncbi:TELO2-interacting protein [Nymphaea thermarum]|nr:TELO2-interacting protein [Nymphaea thermarum]
MPFRSLGVPGKVSESELSKFQVTTAQFLDSLSLSLSHNSVYAGSFAKLMLTNPSPAGYLQSLAELTNIGHLNSNHTTPNILPIISNIPSPFGTRIGNPAEMVYPERELPRMPPWFSRFGAQKLYKAVSGILRLISVSLIIDCRDEVVLSSLIEIPLEYLRKLIFELRQKDYKKESWHSWYVGTGSGRLLRQASTAVCVINEIMYGISGQSRNLYIDMFEKSGRKLAGKQWHWKGETAQSIGTERMPAKSAVQQSVNWMSSKRADAKNQAIDCIGNILHEYLSQDIWSLPVIIDGLGVFSVSLGKDFKRSGFLLDCLYLLLENLICSNDQIKRASDAVLHTLSTSLGHTNVRDMVVENADYIVDSLCRQLRHLDLNPQVPNVIAAVLSYIGMAHDILPLLDEPVSI